LILLTIQPIGLLKNIPLYALPFQPRINQSIFVISLNACIVSDNLCVAMDSKLIDSLSLVLSVLTMRSKDLVLGFFSLKASKEV
jgi:hypothetical protein